MEMLYNPDAMSEAEFKATFVGRESLLREILALIRSQPDGAGVQHMVIISPRGMGKTSVLQMLRYAVLESDMAAAWLPLKFPEELYGVADLADFWLETVRLLALESHAPELAQQAQTLLERFNKRADVAAAAFALLQGFRRHSGKRLLLLVENLHMLFEDIVDEQDAARLRDTLMNDGTVMLAGSAVNFFQQARAYDQPLYNFFAIRHLHPLTFEESRQVLSLRGEQDGIANFADTLQANSARLRTLYLFTQGVPRLVLMLYRVLAQSDVDGVRQTLEKLLDDVTPYYKARVEDLPVQQRKLLEYVTRAAAKTHEGISPTDLAKAVYLPVNQVSMQLKRLVQAGYLRTAPLRGRSTCYLLTEPLYALWHQMRLNPETRTRKLAWLVDFLYHWYDDRERVQEAERLFQQYKEHERVGDGPRALASVEHLQLLGQSALPTSVAGQVQRLAARDLSRLREKHLEPDKAVRMSAALLVQQLADIDEALARHPDDADCWAVKGCLLLWEKREYEAALQCLEHALQLDPNDADSWRDHATTLYHLHRYKEALASEDRSVALDPSNATAWSNRGVTLREMGCFMEALASCDRALTLDPQYNQARNNRATVLADIEDSFLDAIGQNKLEHARTMWGVLHTALDAEAEIPTLKRCVLFAAELGHLAFARELIENAGRREDVFPLDRALAYLQSEDEALIEKLSPEVKEAVRVVVDDLRPALQQAGESHGHPLARVKLALDDAYIAKRGHRTHKIKAKDSTRRWAYYFVLVWASMDQAFLDALKSEASIDLEDYGRVIASCYGETPDEWMKSLLQEKYGFSV